MKNISSDYFKKEVSTVRRPMELYDVWQIDGMERHYTSGDSPVILNGIEYRPATIERSVIRYDSEMEVTKCTIKVGYVEDPVLQFIAINPIQIFWVRIMKFHRDLDPPEVDVLFLGQIKSVTFKGLQAEVECVGFEHYLAAPIPRERYQKTCNWKIFGFGCSGPRFRISSFKRENNIAVLSLEKEHPFIVGSHISIAEVADDLYNGDWTVSNVPDPFHISFENPGPDIDERIEEFGVVFRNMKIYYRTIVDNIVLDETKTKITAPAIGSKPDEYFTGGEVEFPFGKERRSIVAHSGSTITLSYRMIELEDGDLIYIYPGCDGRHTTCKNKFDNILNYFGFPFIPIENPALRT